MKRHGFCLALLCCTLLLLTGKPAVAQLAVVVDARSGVAVLTRHEVMNIFLGRYRKFFNGLEAQPVDLLDSNPGRALFYQALLGKELAEVNAYWSRQIFSGRLPAPIRLRDDDEVLTWVVSHPGGIGFVDAMKVDARVKVVFEFKQ